MRERFIFNFRVAPEELAPHLPQWIEPQVLNGHSVVSFCILVLERLSVWPIPSIINFSTISCAYRIGVVDWSTGEPEPAVYVTDRYADLPLITRISPFIMFDTIPTIHAAIGRSQDSTNLVMSQRDGRALFSADVVTAPTLESQVFATVDEFSEFIRNGVSSYAPSLFPGTLAKVDLYKDEVDYQPITAEVEFSALSGDWPDARLEFDCAVLARAPAGKTAYYKWAFLGLWSEQAGSPEV
jgi:hypothetical protein